MINLEELQSCEANNLDFKIPHRNWQSAYEEALVLLTFATPGEVVAICGPSHTGKTSLLSELKTTFKNPSHQPQGDYHWVQITTGNTGGKASFSFKAFIVELLDLIDHPVYSSNYYLDSDKSTINSRLNRVTEATLVRALIEGLIQRKTRYLVVDEAQDMKYAGKATMAASGVMDALKTLAKKAEVVLVFTGTYPMLNSINCSGHLENRKYDVHLARYRRTQEDLNEFIWILSNYDTALSIDGSLGTLRNCAEILLKAPSAALEFYEKYFDML